MRMHAASQFKEEVISKRQNFRESFTCDLARLEEQLGKLLPMSAEKKEHLDESSEDEVDTVTPKSNQEENAMDLLLRQVKECNSMEFHCALHDSEVTSIEQLGVELQSKT